MQNTTAPHTTLPTSHTTVVNTLTLTSPAFAHNEAIPPMYTCDGENISIPLTIQHVPEGTHSLALVMDDPDIPVAVKEKMGISHFDHWVLYNIPPDTTSIEDGVGVGNLGLNSLGKMEYIGPCPPDGEHRYVFRLYALSQPLTFIKQPTLFEVEEASKSIAIAKAELIGTYKRTISPQ
ncbi:MAG TPA: YbhB/YbcL family Raf kinase inhibitor-like protein [Candidatus Paceibacterota bacterium]|nr:YbhB/YbcL family Raf kinase inhibitor-like protein [Candidatus Paceibacterota bacterium]